jgi:hypothetical protein
MRVCEISYRYPFGEVARKERRSLLAASGMGILIVKTGLLPTKIVALGIEFTETDQKALLAAIATVVAYFLAEFLLYAGPARPFIAATPSSRNPTLGKASPSWQLTTRKYPKPTSYKNSYSKGAVTYRHGP